jgi:hypothetical protein
MWNQVCQDSSTRCSVDRGESRFECLPARGRSSRHRAHRQLRRSRAQGTAADHRSSGATRVRRHCPRTGRRDDRESLGPPHRRAGEPRGPPPCRGPAPPLSNAYPIEPRRLEQRGRRPPGPLARPHPARSCAGLLRPGADHQLGGGPARHAGREPHSPAGDQPRDRGPRSRCDRGPGTVARLAQAAVARSAHAPRALGQPPDQPAPSAAVRPTVATTGPGR